MSATTSTIPTTIHSNSSSNNFFGSTPPTTIFILSVNIGIYILQSIVLDNDVLQKVTMCPRLVLYLHEYYRIITSALFHANLMHIGMNMMSVFAIATMLEKRLGSISLLLTTLWAILLSGIIYLILSYMAYVIVGYDEWMYTQSVGFSGIIFHLSVLECHVISTTTSTSTSTTTATRSLFGFISVPIYLYPWALLILLQFMIPGLSFLGHLSGILTGTFQCYGFFQCIMVNDSFLRELEMSSTSSTTSSFSNTIIHRITKLPNFVSTPNNNHGMIGNTNNNNSGGGNLFHHHPSTLIQTVQSGIGMVIKFFKDVLETIWVCIFGRGYSLNRNVRLWNTTTTSTTTSMDDVGGGGGGRILGGRPLVLSALNEDDDDEDWNGLPSLSPEREQQLLLQQQKQHRHISRLV